MNDKEVENVCGEESVFNCRFISLNTANYCFNCLGPGVLDGVPILNITRALIVIRITIITNMS